MADELHEHDWVPIKEGYPQKICKCGILRTPELKVGQNTVTLSPAAVDVIRWSSSTAPTAGLDLGMSSNGRPSFLLGSGGVTEQRLALGVDDVQYNINKTWQTNPALTTVQNAGTVTTMAFVVGSTPTSVSTANIGWGISDASVATINNDAGWSVSAFTDVKTEHVPNAMFTIRTGAVITAVRYWVGFFSATPMGSATPAVHLAAFRYDTAADGTAFWRCATAAGGAPQLTTTTSSIAASVSYDMRISCLSGSTRFFINGTAVAVHSTTVPTSTQSMGPWAQVRTLDGNSKTIINYRVMIGQAFPWAG